MVRFVVAALVMMASPVMADEVSPWFGGEGQKPFQLVEGQTSDESAAVPANDADLVLAQACAIEGCSSANGSAKVLEANPVSP